MSNQITKANLEAVVARINQISDSPAEPYGKDENGRFKANIGCYHLAGAYGGWQLQRICNSGGAVNEITSGYVSKRELYNQLFVFIAGLEVKEVKE